MYTGACRTYSASCTAPAAGVSMLSYRRPVDTVLCRRASSTSAYVGLTKDTAESVDTRRKVCAAAVAVLAISSYLQGRAWAKVARTKEWR